LIQPRVQCRLIKLGWQGPGNPGFATSTQALLHRRTRRADRRGYLPIPKSFGLEPQCLTYLAHG